MTFDPSWMSALNGIQELLLDPAGRRGCACWAMRGALWWSTQRYPLFVITEVVLKWRKWSVRVLLQVFFLVPMFNRLSFSLSLYCRLERIMLRGSGNKPSFCTTSLPRESHLVSSIFVSTVSAFYLYVHYFVPAHLLSQENPNYSFLLPFAQYNLQCPGYYLPVLQGKWVYPHSSSTCRIWNKIISYSAIRRDPHRGGWVVGRAGGRQVAFFWRSGKRRCIFFHRSCW